MSAFGCHLQTVNEIKALKDEIARLTAERDRAIDRIAAMAAENEQMRAALKMWIDRHKNDESQESLMISYAYALGATEKALQNKGVSQ